MPEEALRLFPEFDYKGYDSSRLADFILGKGRVAVRTGRALAAKATKTIRITNSAPVMNLLIAVKECTNCGDT